MKNKKNRKIFLAISRVGARGLTIAASTIAVVEILRQDYPIGISAGISWLFLSLCLKRIDKE